MFRIQSVRTQLHKIDIANPVKTSFASMRHRYALFVLITDTDGHVGVGESWVNFPLHAAYEREAAFKHVYGPALEGKEVDDVVSFCQDAYNGFVGPAVQSGSVGILLPAVCAIELALWDILGQRKEQSLSQLWFDNPSNKVRVYASGINSPLPADLIKEHMDAGVTLFKLKLGFGEDTDKANLDALASLLGDQAQMALDVNRKWTYEEAQRWLPIIANYKPAWLEEPVRPDDENHLRALEQAADFPISWGENVMMPYGFDVQQWVDNSVHVLQPDLTKYTVPTVALEIIKTAEVKSDTNRVIPHFLGSGPGQAASLHYAAGCQRNLCELDINRNSLRTDLCTPNFDIIDGCIQLPTESGLGYKLK